MSSIAVDQPPRHERTPYLYIDQARASTSKPTVVEPGSVTCESGRAHVGVLLQLQQCCVLCWRSGACGVSTNVRAFGLVHVHYLYVLCFI